ncbi:MAG: hypothetical protein GY874_04295 [Desulfobacteraceae bacterium]|nr:hypothetical protein [Desulfobacteraceae bacterium]
MMIKDSSQCPWFRRHHKTSQIIQENLNVPPLSNIRPETVKSFCSMDVIAHNVD